MSRNKIKMTIITVCLNCEQTIKRTIESVVNQLYDNIEYIIIDGDSKDLTCDIINHYKDKISFFCSEPDNGIYNAMNKGLKHSTGDFVYFLNSGDYLYDNKTVKNVVNSISNHPNFDIIYGDILHYRDNNAIRENCFRSDIFDFIIHGGINHQSLFAKRDVFVQVGFFDEKYKVFSDFDWCLKLLSKGDFKFLHINLPISYVLAGGYSDINAKRYCNELVEIIDKCITKKSMILYIIAKPRYILKISIYISYTPRILLFLLKNNFKFI